MKGIYIIQFSIYPELYKIGCSNNISRRLKDFQQDPINLGEVTLLYKKEFEDYQRAEEAIHNKLKDFRVFPNKEFFKGNLAEFISEIDKIDAQLYLKEETYTKSRLIDSSVAVQLLNLFLERADKESSTITLSAATRKEICELLHISNNQITNNLKKLKDLGLISGDKGNFTINPEIFWKGDMQTRKQVLEGKSLKVSYEIID